MTTTMHDHRARVPGQMIMLIEDDLDVRELTIRLLDSLGYGVVAACSGAHALALWPGLRDRIDLVLSELMLPDGVSGADVSTMLRADRPSLRVVFMTGGAPILPSALADATLLSKPVSAAQLSEAVTNALRPTKPPFD